MSDERLNRLETRIGNLEAKMKDHQKTHDRLTQELLDKIDETNRLLDERLPKPEKDEDPEE